MALNWQSTGTALQDFIESVDEGSKEFNEAVVCRDQLVFATLGTGYPNKGPWKITEENWEEMYRRFHHWEHVIGAFRMGSIDGSDATREVYFTPKEVYSAIGLQTNAGGKTDVQFRKDVFTVMDRESEDRLRAFHDEQKSEG